MLPVTLLKSQKPKKSALYHLTRVLIIVSLAAGCAAPAKKGNLLTWYEKSDCKETPRFEQTIEYCKKLAAASPFICYTAFGTTPQGREMPLLIVDKNGNSDAASVKNSGNAVLLVQACIHAGESDGKDAGLMLLRDIANRGEFASLIDHVTILFIPIFNVDGHERFGPFNRINQNGPEEMGWRTTARNINLNRDFVKADAPEMRAWLKLYNRYLPDFLIDCHTTNGADYQYPLTYSLEINGNMEKDLTDWTRDVYLKTVKKKLEEKNIPIFPYVIFRKRHDFRSGLQDWVSSAMLAHGYTASRNRPGLLLETHMLKDYKTRVDVTYEMIYETIRLLNKEYSSLTDLVSNADSRTSAPEFRQKDLALRFTQSGETELVDFKGFEYRVVKSDLTGGDWIKYSKIPKTFKIPRR